MRWLCIMMMAALAATGCRSTKTIQTAISKKDTVAATDSLNRYDSLRFIAKAYDNIQSNRIEFNTFSAKLKVSFEGSDGKRNDFNAVLRIQKDSVLWVSINALLGIEAFRVMITPDSVKVMNKLDKVMQLRSVSYLKEITKLPFTFGQLQDLLIGNPVYFDSTITSYRKENELITLLDVGDVFRHLITVREPDFTIQYSKLDDVNPVRGRSANITYGEYEQSNGKPFSTFRKITVSDKSKLDIEMKYKQIDFNLPLNFPFNIPKNYKLH